MSGVLWSGFQLYNLVNGWFDDNRQIDYRKTKRITTPKIGLL